MCLAFALAIRPQPRSARQADEGKIVPVGQLLRVPGLIPILIASIVTVTAADLMLIYLPLLGAERHIDASHVGFLLVVKSLAALVARAAYAKLIAVFGRRPLTLSSSLVAAGAFALLVVPSLPVMYIAAIAIGLGLGVASTLTLSAVADIAPPEARGTAMSLRITGNRIGLVLMPLVAGVVAAGTGVIGIFLLNALTLATCAVALQRTPVSRAGLPRRSRQRCYRRRSSGAAMISAQNTLYSTRRVGRGDAHLGASRLSMLARCGADPRQPENASASVW